MRHQSQDYSDLTMRTPRAVYRRNGDYDSSRVPAEVSLFRGLGLLFLGFDSESIQLAASIAASAAAATNHNTDEPSENACGSSGESKMLRLACADVAAARSLLQEMEEKATAEGAQVIAASRAGIAAAGLFVCNFSVAFAHLRRLAEQEPTQARYVPEEPLQLVAALELEPLRLLTPFWLFACLRDRRVYAPDAHPLFRVSAALTPTQPPLFMGQRPLPSQQQEQSVARKQRVLLLGCTYRLRRVRRSSALGSTVSDSEYDESDAQSVAGHALAAHDQDIAAACVEALGGCNVTAAEVSKTDEVVMNCDKAAKGAGSHGLMENLGVDIVVVGHLPALLKRSLRRTADPRSLPSPAQKRSAAAAAELSLLRNLEDRGVACVRLQWLLDAYRSGRVPPFELYAIAAQQLHQVPAAPTTVALRRKVLHGVQLLVSDLALTRDPTLLQRLAGLGCTDVTAVPSLLGLCPWLFHCSATRELAAVLCGSQGRFQLVGAALQRAEDACQKTCPEPPVLFVMHREETAGLFDLAAIVAEVTEATALFSQKAPTHKDTPGRAASSRHVASHHSPSDQQKQQQQQKVHRLVAAAKQRVLHYLPPASAVAAQGQWDLAAEAAASSGAQVDDVAASIQMRNATAAGGIRPRIVSPEWIVGCWEDARRLPIDVAHGRIEVPDLWTEGVSDSTGHWEDAALMTALTDCGGAVVYGDFPMVADAKEARLRRALGALEHALTVSWDIFQQYQYCPGGQETRWESPASC